MARGGGGWGESRGVLNYFFIEMGGLENYIMLKEEGGGSSDFSQQKDCFSLYTMNSQKRCIKCPLNWNTGY
jgi:hypothetical protein